MGSDRPDSSSSTPPRPEQGFLIRLTEALVMAQLQHAQSRMLAAQDELRAQGSPQQVSPDSPEYRNVHRILRSVEATSGLPLRWNLRLLETHPPPGYQQTNAPHTYVSRDGTLALPRPVLDTINLAYSDRPLTEPDRLDIIDALSTVSHEGSHLLRLPDDPGPDGEHPWADAATLAFDEGLAEHFAHAHVTDVAIDTGLLNRIMPTVILQKPAVAWPASFGATEKLLANLADATQRRHRPDEIFRLVHATPLVDRWHTVTELVIRSLPDPGSPAARDELRRQLTAPVRAAFTDVGAINRGTGMHGAEMLANGRALMTTAYQQVAVLALPGVVKASQAAMTAALAPAVAAEFATITPDQTPRAATAQPRSIPPRDTSLGRG